MTLRPLTRGVALALALVLVAGCSSQSAASRCYAKALPSRGEGSLAWGANPGAARKKSLHNCALYAERSGGTPRTCKVVLEQCK
ncbi:hypothetical protein [Pseudomonas eucalypticola]|uniref:DUF4189 domain-containing protein n=1 Tax=Pseudomonas eucalypticola TaxID=2599595 RepID=A0A7D5D7Y4_9PSED|nr:hypothetical protein [Pseudomonas eucalypticola]QKZ04375.1 hypothetical protein HWQ56_11480 [Pseudomonas eucalypticola]